MLENKNIILRAVELSDIENIYEWENNPEIWHLSNTVAPFSKYLLKKHIETSNNDVFADHQIRLVIELKSNKRAIGCIDLFDFDFFNSRAGVGILIHNPKDRKNNYASEALETLIEYSFNTLLINQLFCNITADNTASLRLFNKFGFNINGTKKNWTNVKGEFKDEHFLQLFNE